MFKQVYLYDGTAVLLESVTQYTDEGEPIETFSYPKEYTELQPVDGLYQPIFFDGEKWIGTKKEVWEAANPPEPTENQSISNEEVQHLIEDLTLQLLSLQIEIDEKKVLENE